MNGFTDVVLTAFILQLLALPGEKGQLIIASLATKYNPYQVVAGAVTAFGGWTAIEIVVGTALKGAIPGLYLDGVTAGLFILFAAWILQASPDKQSQFPTMISTDGGTCHNLSIGAVDSPRLRGFGSAFALMMAGEFGDKTQLVTIGLAVQYGATPAIWFGEMIAIVPVSLGTALAFDRAAHRFNQVWVHRIAATMFLFFAVDIIMKHTLNVSILPF